nr:unnamed protein product [Callosobruchus analis]
MEVNRLLSDELTYELQVRGLPIGNTVAEKRLLLRESLRQERLGLSVPPSKCNMVVDHELIVCTGKLGELRRAVGQFDDSNRDNEFRRIYSTLIHVSDRLSRIGCETPLLEAQRASLISDANELIRELNVAYEEAREGDSEQSQTRKATTTEYPQTITSNGEPLDKYFKDGNLHESRPQDLIDLSGSGSLRGFQTSQPDNSLIDMPNDLLPVVLHQQDGRNRRPQPHNLEDPLTGQGYVLRNTFSRLNINERPTLGQIFSARPLSQISDDVNPTSKEVIAPSRESKSYRDDNQIAGNSDLTYDRYRAHVPTTAQTIQPYRPYQSPKYPGSDGRYFHTASPWHDHDRSFDLRHNNDQNSTFRD